MTKSEQWDKEFRVFLQKAYCQMIDVDERQTGKTLEWGQVRGYDYLESWLRGFIRSLLKQARQEARSELTAQLEAIVAKNTDKELGTTDYDGLAEGVLAWLAKWRKREK